VISGLCERVLFPSSQYWMGMRPWCRLYFDLFTTSSCSFVDRAQWKEPQTAGIPRG